MPPQDPTAPRGLSLWQLSASAIAHGAKTIETRTWPAPEWILGQRVGIHASKTLGPGGLFELGLWLKEEVNHSWAFGVGYLELDGTQPQGLRAHPEALPRGAFLATAVIAACLPTEELAPLVSDLEWSHGDYSPGRYGWVLAEVHRLREPVTYTGALGLYKIDPPVWERVLKLQEPDSTPAVSTEPPTDQRRPIPRRFSR